MDQDFEQAAKYFELAAAQGHGKSMTNLGVMYREGIYFAKDYDASREWIFKAVETEEPNAYFNMALLYYFSDLGVEPDAAKAVEWFKKAADSGNILSHTYLGMLTHDGIGVVRDYQRAVEYYRFAADLGEPQAQFQLGRMMYDGKGIKKAERQGARLITASAEQGWVEAQFLVGLMCWEGWGRRIDYEEAARWFEAAAEKGHRDAQYLLGVSYYEGYGVDENARKAYKWLSLASYQGHEGAEKIMRRLERVLPEDYMAEANEEVEAWMLERAFDPSDFILE